VTPCDGSHSTVTGRCRASPELLGGAQAIMKHVGTAGFAISLVVWITMRDTSRYSALDRHE
jgi:hypothetical protein